MAETPRTDAYGMLPVADVINDCLTDPAKEALTKLLCGWGDLSRELERQLAEAERQARIFHAQVEERGRTIEATRLQLETARQDERERCAKVCDELGNSEDDASRKHALGAWNCAAAIRSLPDEEGK